jgi:ribokinase
LRVRLVVIGGINMDLVVQVPRLPRPGETVTGEALVRAGGGKGANQAVAAARLGAEAVLVARVGHDAFGRELTAALRDSGVSTRWVLGCDQPTGAALIEVDPSGENCIAVAPGANLELLPEDIPRRAVAEADAVVAPLEAPLASIEEAFRLARLAGVRTALNAAPARPDLGSLLRYTDVLVVNEVEAATLLSLPSVPEGGEVEAARRLRSSLEQVVVITLGARGAIAVAGSAVVAQPGFNVSVVDTTGAGDAFVAGFVVGQWWSAGLGSALRLGCAAGALATTRAGAQPSLPSLAEVDALLAR